jgi:ribonucleoside-diphosphate reductase alpha chain
VFDPRGGQWMGGRYVPSFLAAIGEVIERHMIAIGFLKRPGARDEGETHRQPRVAAMGGEDHDTGHGRDGHGGASGMLRQCPKCAQASLVRQEGCDTCTSCGYSKCG